MADLLFIVSRTEPKTFVDIKHQFANESRYVRVVFDRRGRDRRRSQRPPPTERRHVERRQHDVTRELQSSGWAVVKLVEDATRCVQSGCREEGVVGLHGAWLCLAHFESRGGGVTARASSRLSRHSAWTRP